MLDNILFISHRTTDKDVAGMLLDFLTSLGFQKEKAFCSSLPGNAIGLS
jgi:coproporphyrinogen III oxidase